MITWEDRTHALLTDCSILDVLSIQLARYKDQHRQEPQIVIMHRSLKGPLIREVFLSHGLEPADTVIEPIWLGSVPVIFRNMPEHYLRIIDNSTKKELCL